MSHVSPLPTPPETVPIVNETSERIVRVRGPRAAALGAAVRGLGGLG